MNLYIIFFFKKIRTINNWFSLIYNKIKSNSILISIGFILINSLIQKSFTFIFM